MEYYLSMRKKAIMPFAGQWTELKTNMYRQRKHTQKHRCYMLSFMLNLKKKIQPTKTTTTTTTTKA